MLALARKSDPGTLIRRDVANYLHEAFSSEDGALGWMDRAACYRPEHGQD